MELREEDVDSEFEIGRRKRAAESGRVMVTLEFGITEQGFIEVTDSLGFSWCAESLGDALEGWAEYFAFQWQDIARSPDERLGGDAIALKRRLIAATGLEPEQAPSLTRAH